LFNNHYPVAVFVVVITIKFNTLGRVANASGLINQRQSLVIVIFIFLPPIDLIIAQHP
jgi:hypothetical protein